MNWETILVYLIKTTCFYGAEIPPTLKYWFWRAFFWLRLCRSPRKGFIDIALVCFNSRRGENIHKTNLCIMTLGWCAFRKPSELSTLLLYLLRNAWNAKTSYITELKWLNSASLPLHPNKHRCTCLHFTQFFKSINQNTGSYYPQIIMPTELPFVSPNCQNNFYFYRYHILFLIRTSRGLLAKNHSKDFTVTDS